MESVIMNLYNRVYLSLKKGRILTSISLKQKIGIVKGRISNVN